MNRIYVLVTLLFFTVGPFWYGSVIYDDLCHPELWDQDFNHDPRLYLPLLAVVLPVCGLLAWRQARKLHQAAEDLRRLR